MKRLVIPPLKRFNSSMVRLLQKEHTILARMNHVSIPQWYDYYCQRGFELYGAFGFNSSMVRLLPALPPFCHVVGVFQFLNGTIITNPRRASCNF